MRHVLEDIEVGRVAEAVSRLGVPPHQRVRVVIETDDKDEKDDPDMARMAEEGGAFDFLADEPDLYTEADIKRRNV